MPRAARALLYIYVVLVACPIRYWPFDPLLDNTWVFALNWAAAHGLAMGRDIVWTTGPLSYLVFPQDLGNNLIHGLIFQTAAWAILAAIFADVFFRQNFELRNLAIFCVFFGFSAPLYWTNYMGLENLLLAAVLVLLVVARLRASVFHFVAALVLVGVIPLIKLTGGIVAAGAVIGYVVCGKRVARDAGLAIAVPTAVFGAGCLILLPSFDAILRYLRGSLEISNGYSVAMSLAGNPNESIEAWLVGAMIAALAILTRRPFFLVFLALPVFLSVKHGFVRADFHVLNYFCFAALALGLIAMAAAFDDKLLGKVFIMAVVYGIIWLQVIAPRLGIDGLKQALGIQAMPLVYNALHLDRTRATLDARSREDWAKFRIGPRIREIVQSTPVASLSISYSSAPQDGLNLKLYPVPQRYAAYTPYLDGLNAAWVRDHGPRFLIFAWERIDERNPWTETPAMWLEVYRWYNTRLLEGRNLLLERRAEPRFSKLQSAQAADAAFFSMRCPMSTEGKLRKLFFRVPEITMDSYRALPDVMTAPVIGRPPENLVETAALLDASAIPKTQSHRANLSGPGASSYGVCAFEFFRPADQTHLDFYSAN